MIDRMVCRRARVLAAALVVAIAAAGSAANAQVVPYARPLAVVPVPESVNDGVAEALLRAPFAVEGDGPILYVLASNNEASRLFLRDHGNRLGDFQVRWLILPARDVNPELIGEVGATRSARIARLAIQNGLPAVRVSIRTSGERNAIYQYYVRSMMQLREQFQRAYGLPDIAFRISEPTFLWFEGGRAQMWRSYESEAQGQVEAMLQRVRARGDRPLGAVASGR